MPDSGLGTGHGSVLSWLFCEVLSSAVHKQSRSRAWFRGVLSLWDIPIHRTQILLSLSSLPGTPLKADPYDTSFRNPPCLSPDPHPTQSGGHAGTKPWQQTETRACHMLGNCSTVELHLSHLENIDILF